MKKLGFFLFAVAVALSISFIGKATASASSFPQCKPAPDDFCMTGPGGETILVDFRNK